MQQQMQHEINDRERKLLILERAAADNLHAVRAEILQIFESRITGSTPSEEVMLSPPEMPAGFPNSQEMEPHAAPQRSTSRKKTRDSDIPPSLSSDTAKQRPIETESLITKTEAFPTPDADAEAPRTALAIPEGNFHGTECPETTTETPVDGTTEVPNPFSSFECEGEAPLDQNDFSPQASMSEKCQAISPEILSFSAGDDATGLSADASQSAPMLADISFSEESPASVWGGEFGGDDGGSVTFIPDRTLAGVPCSSPESLAALYESSNKINTAPEGFKIQKSTAAVCAVTRNNSSEIYLVWQMTETKQSLVCTPERQPRDEASFRKIFHEAIFYFECIGFMMSAVDLSQPSMKNNAYCRLPVS